MKTSQITHSLSVTLGSGKARPIGATVPLCGDPVPALVDILGALVDHGDDSRNDWWSPSTFRGAHRSKQSWETAAAIGVDADFYRDGQHALLADDLVNRIDELIVSGALPGNVAHRTPRGLRLIAVFSFPCLDEDTYRDAQQGFCTMVEGALARAGLLTSGSEELRLDTGASLDRARFFWGPRGRPVVTMRSTPLDSTLLAALAPEDQQPPKTAPRARGDASGLESAKLRFNEDHPGSWPKSGGTCPACGHNDCFGQLADDQRRWVCHSSNHGPDSGGVGVEGSSCWTGDALDLALKAAGFTSKDLIPFLRSQCYLAAHNPSSRAAVRERTANPKGTLVCLADVEPEELTWLWSGRIPFGKLTVIDGDPGLGKSTLTLEIAARLSRGEALPGHEGGMFEAAGTLLLSGEDGLADTIRPRLEAAGADVSRIHALTLVGERMPALGDVAELEAAAAGVGARLIVVDPLMAYLGEGTNAHKDSDIRRLLSPVAKLAEKLGAAFVVVRHLNKSNGGHALYRGGGSIGITGAARSALLVGKDPNDPDARVLAPTKCNLAALARSLRFKLEKVSGDSGAARVVWLGESGLTADDLVQPMVIQEHPGAIADAKSFLREILRDGPVKSNDVKAQAKEAGLTWATVRRAKEVLKVQSRHPSPSGPWYWSLPSGAQDDGVDICSESETEE